MTANNLKAHCANNLATFTQALNQHRFWHILPKGEKDTLKSLGVFDTTTQKLWPATISKLVSALGEFLKQHPFVDVHDSPTQQYQATLHTATKLLWSKGTSNDTYSVQDAKQLLNKEQFAGLSDWQTDNGRRRHRLLNKEQFAGLSGWQLPSVDMLKTFATATNNPHRYGSYNRLRNAVGNSQCYWLTDSGRCDTDNFSIASDSNATGFIFASHPLWVNASNLQILLDLAEKGWELRVPSNANAVFTPPVADTRWQGQSVEDLLTAWVKEGLHLESFASTSKSKKSIEPTRLHPGDFALTEQLAKLDYTPCRLPRLDNAQLSDPEKGLWELWGQDAATLQKNGLVARDPQRDLQNGVVAIDFGTSSTVVAMDTAHGTHELLRIGVRDFYQPIEAQQFENPTVLECVDFNAFQSAWTARAYRPELDWNWMRAAHEAQSNFRDNPGDTRVLARIVPRLKHWALRSSEHRRVRLTDSLGHETELPPHTERNPVRGQPLTVSASTPFDPIELYAWYLGMAINWRGRGLFLKYYLSFPVKYERKVKDCILASFRCGLQRSLPPSLIEHHPEVLHRFEVTDLASEPAAYAAAALPHLGVDPTEDGVPYAVFDFGGGTTDFDFGLLRWATDEEEAQGYERVFEHLASSGDNFLGGENLLEHLVYASFQHNLAVLRAKRIQFTQPLDAAGFAGSEAFLAPTQAAQTNTVMLAAKLRPFLENDTAELDSQIKLDLIDADGNKQPCELALDAEALDALLSQRMRRGVQAFMAELARLRPQLPAHATIHILLAGNGSRSRHITALFDDKGELWPQLLTQAFGTGNEPGNTPPDITIHAPLPMDDDHPHAPTTKTGVALGLLRLVPGANTLLHNHVHERHEGQAPFAWFVGRMRRGRFEPVLSPDTLYGQWLELGPLQQGVFNLFASASPRARNGLPEGDVELRKHRQEFAAAAPGARLFARASAPDTLELTTAADADTLNTRTEHIIITVLKLA